MSDQTDFVRRYFDLAAKIAQDIDVAKVDAMARGIADVREAGGRLFLLGVGGSAGNCSHAVNDFRKLCNVQAYTPTDNVSELTARTNDDGWEHVFSDWLKVNRPTADDALLIYSVGGGDRERNLSVNLIRAMDLADETGMKVFAIVGRPNGHAGQNADIAVVVPCPEPKLVTPLSEAYQAVVWHCVVSHPALATKAATW